jgi:hypothetical protein
VYAVQEAFFGGWSPRDLREKDDGIDELRRKLDQVLGRSESGEREGDGLAEEYQETKERDPPWLVCCIQSYIPEDASLSGSRCFRIFDTKLTL